MEKKFNDTSSALSRFGRDKRVRTVTAAPERVERRPHAEHSEEGPRRREEHGEQPARRASYNPHFSEDNRPLFGDRRERRPYGDRPYGDRPRRDERRPYGEQRPYGDRAERPAYGDRPKRSFGDHDGKPAFGHKPFEHKSFDRKPYGHKPYGSKPFDRKPYDGEGAAERPAYGDRPERGDRRPYGDKPYGDRPYGEKSYGDRSFGGRKYGAHGDRKFGDKPYGEKSYGDKPYGDKSSGNKPYGAKKYGDKKYGDRPFDGKRGGHAAFRRDDERPRSYPKFAAEQTGEMRLNRFLAQSGLCSRREADDYITAGLVTVNGVIVSELGTKVLPTDEVKFNDSRVQGEKKVYLVLNKPKGFVTSLEDPHADKLVMDLVKGACTERIYPVGRLDKNSVGLLLFTNDGDLTKTLTHPSYRKKKIYQVSLDKPLTRADMDRLTEGITLEDGEIFADEISYLKENKQEIGIEIHSGRNRIVRRMFEFLGYAVTKLDRVYYAGLTKKNLKRGAWRFLTREEVERLKSGMYE